MSYLHHFAHPKIPRTAPFRTVLAAGCIAVHHTVARLFDSPKCCRRMFDAAGAQNPGERWFDPVFPLVSFEGDWVFPTRDIEFDGMVLRGPRDADAVLRTYYGNYMELPPMEDRYTHLPLVLDFGDGKNVMER
jgi:lipopolysaccharide cholinephosphotransferase